VGKLADLVLWSPAFFGIKPDLILKGGFIVGATMGDPNASIPTPEPVRYRPMFGRVRPRGSGDVVTVRLGRVLAEKAAAAVARANAAAGVEYAKVRQARHGLNDSMPTIEIDPSAYTVTIDACRDALRPAATLPLGAALLSLLTRRHVVDVIIVSELAARRRSVDAIARIELPMTAHDRRPRAPAWWMRRTAGGWRWSFTPAPC
jgi:hypothetical protein